MSGRCIERRYLGIFQCTKVYHTMNDYIYIYMCVLLLYFIQNIMAILKYTFKKKKKAMPLCH